MAKEVIKKDGRRDFFNADKIRQSISMAATEAGIEESRKNELIDEITTATVQMSDMKDEIQTSEIKNFILEKLDSSEPSVSSAWRKYDSEQGK